MKRLDKHDLSHYVIHACVEVHKNLEKRFPKEVYLNALEHEIKMLEFSFEKNIVIDLPVIYKKNKISTKLIIDALIGDKILLKLIYDEIITELDKEQFVEMLKLTKYEYGFLVSFYVKNIRDGIKRLVVSKNAPENFHWKAI